jgi:hypothetical protein
MIDLRDHIFNGHNVGQAGKGWNRESSRFDAAGNLESSKCSKTYTDRPRRVAGRRDQVADVAHT